MATLTVGQGQPFTRIADAVKAARPGDVVKVRPGTYVDDFPVVKVPLTIQADGGKVKLVATGPVPNRKGIIIADADLTVIGLDFEGAQVEDLNGAGIRLQAGNLVVRDSHFANNQMHILTNNYGNGSITITGSEFGPTLGSRKLSHSVYVGHIQKLEARDNYFHDTITGHHIKTRAKECVIVNNRLEDGQGRSDYSIDMPNGGKCQVTGNYMVQGVHAGNSNFIHFGGEGESHPGSSLVVSGNVFVNDKESGNGTILLNQSGADVTLTGNQIYRVPTLGSGRYMEEGNILLKVRPEWNLKTGRVEPVAATQQIAYTPENVQKLAGSGMLLPSAGLALAVLGVAGLRFWHRRR